MKKKRRLPAMLIPTLVMGLLAIILIYLGYRQGVHIAGLKLSWNMLLQMLPILILAMVVAGMVQKLIPSEIIARWIGTESGFRGILIGAAIGACTPGGPYVTLPIAAGLLRMGANVGTMVTFMTAWSLIGLSRIPLEVGIMGWKFWLIRLGCTFFFAPIAGLLANTFFLRAKII